MNFDMLKQYEPIVIKGHDNEDFDSIASCYLLQKLFNIKNINSIVAFDNNNIEQIFDLKEYPINYKFGISEEDKLFLVDHYCDYTNNIIGCIEHHPVDFNNSENFIYKQQSSCAKIIYDEMQKENINLSVQDIYLVVKSLYMDTFSFMSLKAIDVDKIFAYNMCIKYDFDQKELYNEGLMLTDLSTINDEIVYNGFKEFIYKNHTIGTSYANTLQKPDAFVINDILSTIKNNNEYDYYMYFITAIEDNKTYTYTLHNNYCEDQEYQGVMSRSVHLLPLLKNKIDISQNIKNNEMTK